MRFLLSCFCLPLCLILLAGCGTSPERRLEAPIVEVTDLTAKKKGDYVLTVRITNSNTVPLVIERSTHTIYLGGQHIARIEDRKPIGVPPLGSVPHNIKLSDKVAADVRAWLDKHPGQTAVSVESGFYVVVGSDNDTVLLKSAGRGSVSAP